MNDRIFKTIDKIYTYYETCSTPCVENTAWRRMRGAEDDPKRIAMGKCIYNFARRHFDSYIPWGLSTIFTRRFIGPAPINQFFEMTEEKFHYTKYKRVQQWKKLR